MVLYCENWNIFSDEGTLLVVDIEGTDGFSINFLDQVDVNLFIEHFKDTSFLGLKSFIEKKWQEDKEYFNKYILEKNYSEQEDNSKALRNES